MYQLCSAASACIAFSSFILAFLVPTLLFLSCFTPIFTNIFSHHVPHTWITHPNTVADQVGLHLLLRKACHSSSGPCQQNSTPCHTAKTAQEWQDNQIFPQSQSHQAPVGCARTNPIHRCPTLQPPELKQLAAKVLVSDIAGHPPRDFSTTRLDI